MTASARDIMTGGIDCAKENDTVLDAARRMQQLDVGALPICGEDEKLKGVITDRDIVVNVIAAGKDPQSTKVSELAQGTPLTVSADDSTDDVVRVMAGSEVKRVIVLDDRKLVGIISEADLAEHATPEQVVAVVRGVYGD
jgi:CBS domain-containing protein